uniref:Putative conserved secreted protein n=1 Tax=Rhipicephalus microplus TaxID=6941 RepID=A0A6M2CYU0_RHIMP
MKNLFLLVAVLLLSAALFTEAQRFPGGGGGGGFPRPGGGRRCGNLVCRPRQRCVPQQVQCIRAPCPTLYRCV